MADAPVLINTYQNIVLLKVDKDRLLEITVINSLAEAMMHQLDLHPRISLVVELSSVTHMSSAMLGKFVALQKAIKKGKGRLALTNMAPSIFEIFKMTKLNKLFDIKDTAEEVVNFYKRKPL
ncbi:MAG: STAS domain-containing protein [Planctomycetes bacterium]|nr:STAS domain-containing protein [Planctomycetota bacterium]